MRSLAVLQMNWEGIKDGQLLVLSESEFDAFITVDRNLPLGQGKRGIDMKLAMFDRVKVKKDLVDKKLLADDEGVIMEIATAKDGTIGYVIELSEGQQNGVWIETLTAEKIELVENYALARSR